MKTESEKYETIDLRDVLIKLWKRKWVILLVTTLFAISSIFFALSLPNTYKSEALLISNSEEQGSLGGLAGQFGGLASLAGINVSSGGTDKVTYAIEVIKSRDFLYEFIRTQNLKPILFAVESWDRNTDNLVYDNSLYDVSSKSWVVNKDQQEPTLHQAYKRILSDHLVLEQDRESGMTKIAFIHESPSIAKEIVVKLVKAINSKIKQQDMEEATTKIAYLKNEIIDTNVSEMRATFYQLIERQYQSLMLTKVREDYVFKVVDSAIVAEDKYGPNRAGIVILLSLLGGLLSLAWALFKN